MSDSDDTDVLLLIPPDFFFVAPSPSPASTPLNLTPPSPINRSLFKHSQLSLNEQQTIESLKELTSQLKFIERRLSAVETQRSGSMDDENPSIWYDLESYETSNSRYQPQISAHRQSINVQELLQATAQDSKSLGQQQDSLMMHSWGHSSKEYPMSSNKHFNGARGRESASKVASQERNDSSDDEYVSRERRASSLPPMPSSCLLGQTPSTKQASCHPPSGYQKDEKSPLWGEFPERNIGRAGWETLLGGRKGPFGADSRPQDAEWANKYPERKSAIADRVPENKSERAELKHGEAMRPDYEKTIDEDGQSFNLNASGMDGTLGVSALVPSLSTLGLNASLSHPASLDTTKETSGSTEAGTCRRFTLAQVEKLLHDMQKTQMEMERSMRKGMEHLGREEKDCVVRPQSAKIKSDLDGIDNSHGSMQKESKIPQVSGVEKRNLEGEKMKDREEVKQDEQKVPRQHCTSSTAPVSVTVERQREADESRSTGGKYHPEIKDKPFSERGPTEEQPDHERCPIYRSKSDESISGKYGRSAGDNDTHRYLGTDSGDDSYVSSGPINASRITRLGDTLGSVPDLGLGVRKMFAKPGKRQDTVKEPPFVKKNISLLGAINPTAVDAVVKVKEGNSVAECRPTSDKIIIEKTKFSSPTSSFQNEETGPRPLKHPNKEYSHPVREGEITDDAPPPLPTTGLRHLVRESNGNQRKSVREGDDGKGVECRRVEEHSLQVVSPLMVVGGDGPRKSWRDERKDNTRENLRRQEESARVHDQQRRRHVQTCLDAAMSQEIAREDVDAAQRSRECKRGGDGPVERPYEQRNLDGVKERHARFRDNGYGGSARSLFRGLPPKDVHRLFPASDMWIPPLPSDVEEAASEVALVLRRKLEEERFRREHCERVIEEVGRRALEAQERLAVSEGMSKAKDVALGKFHDTWEEAVRGWKRESEARKALEEELERQRGRADAEMAFRDKRLKQLEGEVVRLGDESCSLREELRKGQRETAEITARLSTMLEVATKEVTSCRKEAEIAFLKEAQAKDEALKASGASKEAKEKMDEATKRADLLESEKVMMKQELETLQGKLRDFTNRISTLESNLAGAEVAVDKARQNEKSSRENLVLGQQDWEKERIKLKEFYQSQVEELVRAKVNEFQGQLDAVENSLRKEAELREEEAKKLGEERLRILNEKHSQEVNLLEQKHEEELALWSLRLKRAMSEVDGLKEQVSKHNAKKSQLAKGLHALMQAQLKQGLRLIASGGDIDHEAIKSPPRRTEKPSLEKSWREVMASLNIPENMQDLPEKEYHLKKDYIKEKRLQSKAKVDKDLFQSNGNKESLVPNSDLKKYIHMLLGQEPGKPVGLTDLSSESEEDYGFQSLERKHFMTKETVKPIIMTDDPKVVVRERKRSRKLKTKVADKEDVCKLSRDVPVALWEPMAFKLGQAPPPMSNAFESDTHDQENRRSRKPPWK